MIVKLYVLILTAAMLYLSYGWANSYLNTVEALMYYEAARSQYEALSRTVGRGVETAYVCKRSVR